MPVIFRCVSCNKRLSIARRKAGTDVTCPKCAAGQTVPFAPAGAVTATPPAAQSRPDPVPIAPRRPSPVATPKPPAYPTRQIAAAGLGLALLLGAYLFGRAHSREYAPSKGQVAAAVTVPPRAESERMSEPLPPYEPPTPALPQPTARHPEVPSAGAKTTAGFVPSKPEPAVRLEPDSPRLVVKRRQRLDAEELRRELLAMTEVDLDRTPGTSRSLTRGVKAMWPNKPVTLAGLVETRSDLAGLPMRMGADCQLGKEHAENLRLYSARLRELLNKATSNSDTRPDPVVLHQFLTGGSPPASAREASGRRAVSNFDWLTPEAVPALMQLTQAENTPVRKVLVKILERIPGKEAGAALANRAVMDLSEDVRELAIQALRGRPEDEYLSVLLEAFRYPWVPVVEHAAEAVVALDLKNAVTPLVKLAAGPDPAMPAVDWDSPNHTNAVREVVRINHLRNCVLCHATGSSGDPVAGAVPSPGQPLPSPGSPTYYRGGTIFVRADITYLRQDFSIIQPVEDHDIWPAHQRFDYVVRRRPVTITEAQALEQEIAARKSSPHLEATLFALRELTGKDLGNYGWAWLALLPPDSQPKGPGALP